MQRVAQKYLHPDHLVILAVGDAETVAKGGYDKAPDVTLEAFGAHAAVATKPRDDEALTSVAARGGTLQMVLVCRHGVRLVRRDGERRAVRRFHHRRTTRRGKSIPGRS